MRPRQPAWLLHPLFLVSLSILLLNDGVLKYNYHNALTGKLSDFSGLIALPLFLLAYFPQRRKFILCTCALLFCWWKMPISQPFIDLANRVLPFRVSRVLDYTDLLALLVLPLVNLVMIRPLPLPPIRRGLLVRFLSLVALFAFCHTTAIRLPNYYLPDNLVRFNRTFSTHKSEEELLRLLVTNGATVRQDSVKFYRIIAPNMYYGTKLPGDSAMTFRPVINENDSMLYTREKSWQPINTISSYRLDDLQLTELEFTISKEKRRNYVTIRSFLLDNHRHPEPISSDDIRKIRKHFKHLFK